LSYCTQEQRTSQPAEIREAKQLRALNQLIRDGYVQHKTHCVVGDTGENPRM